MTKRKKTFSLSLTEHDSLAFVCPTFERSVSEIPASTANVMDVKGPCLKEHLKHLTETVFASLRIIHRPCCDLKKGLFLQ